MIQLVMISTVGDQMKSMNIEFEEVKDRAVEIAEQNRDITGLQEEERDGNSCFS